MNIILTVGISGSGKSSWTIEFLKKNPNYLCINRDLLRTALVRNLRGYYQRKDIGFLESTVNFMSESIVLCAINEGYNLIIDATNLTEKYITQYVNEIRTAYTLEFKLFPCATAIAQYRVMNRDFKDLIQDGEPLDLAPVAYIERQQQQYKQIEQIIKQKYAANILQ